jgi:uncharacterized protein (TIGR02246 family)
MISHKQTRAIGALVLALTAGSALAQAPKKSPPGEQQPVVEKSSDEAAIRASAEDYVKAFNAADAKAIAAAWIAEGELHDAAGRAFQGRDEIEQEFTQIFADQPGAEIDVNIDSIKFLNPDVAVETGSSHARSKKGSAGPPIKYSAVHVKRDGQWKLANVTEARVAVPSGAQRLAGLAFLVGEWKASLGEGKTYRMKCQWLPDKSFLSRTFTVSDGEQTLSSGTQIIGWDPILNQIVSWTFDSTGGFGHEIWQDTGSRWEVDASSVLPSGQTALAINHLVPLSNDAFTWQSVERSLGDQLLPDTSLVRVERVSE